MKILPLRVFVMWAALAATPFVAMFLVPPMAAATASDIAVTTDAGAPVAAANSPAEARAPQTEEEALGTVKAFVSALRERDWGDAVGLGVLLLVFVFVRFVVPRLHGTHAARITAGVLGWSSYVAANVRSGDGAMDILITAVIGLLVVLAAVLPLGVKPQQPIAPATPATPTAAAVSDKGHGQVVLLTLLALVALAGLAILTLTTGCGRIPGAVKADSLDLSERLVPYYQVDSSFDDARRESRIEVVAQHVATTNDGWMTRPFKDGAVLVSCRLDGYTRSDVLLDATKKAELLARTRAFRVAVGKPAECPAEVGR